MKKLYDTTMISEGGRSGKVSAPDGSMQLNITTPGKGQDEGTNPEQLFAAGYSACFNSALEVVMLKANKKAKSIVEANVSLNETDDHGYVVSVVLTGEIEGMSKEETMDLMEQAHQVCPYSKATRGNIEVELKVK